MLEHHVPSVVHITADEFAELRELATGRRWLNVQFNSGVIQLENTWINHWAFPILAEKRGLSK